jgi:O-antigen/teichoic acid export membrane protein
LVWTWVLVLSGLADLGLPTAMIRLLPEYLQQGEHALLRGLLLGGRAVAVLFGTFLAALALALLWLIGERINSHYLLPAYLAIACIPLCALSNVQDGIGRGRGWMAVGLIPPYILRPLLLIGGMTAAHQLALPTHASTAVGAAVVSTWSAALLQMLLVERRTQAEIGRPARHYDCKRWCKVTLPLLIITICDLALQNTDALIVSAYLRGGECRG